MRVMPADLVELDDCTTWLRHGGRMVQVELDDAGWLLASGVMGGGDQVVMRSRALSTPAPRALPPAPAPRTVRGGRPPKQLPPAPPTGKRRGRPPKVREEAATVEPSNPKGYSRKASDPAVVERARHLVEEEGLTPKTAGLQIGKSGSAVHNWAEKQRWVTPAKHRAAHRLMQDKGYSLKQASAAVKVPADRLEHVMSLRDPSPRERQQKAQRKREVRAPAPTRTEAERCPSCRKWTHQNPCDNCFERR